MQGCKLHIEPLLPLTRIVLTLAACLMVCCTEIGVIVCDDGVEAEGYLQIYPDQETYTLPGMTYYFYNMDGQTACLAYPCDGKGNFEGRVPVGTYRVIAVNPEAENVKFTGMDRYETAMATATKLAPGAQMNAAEKKQATRGSQSITFDWSVGDWGKELVGPGDVYLVNLGGFDVSGTETICHRPVPQLLTRRVRIRFVLGDNLLPQVLNIEGTLCGVYPSVKLFGGEPWLDGIENISASTVGFEAAYQQQEWFALVNVFGLCHPGYGEAYTSTLDLTLTCTDNRKMSAQVDLTEQLSDVIEQLEGVIPVILSLELEIEADKAEITVDIVPWEPGGEDINIEL